ncbi:MAG: hypothetical protein ACYC8T_21275 [Myxococcaceae bacterium]
MGTGTKILAGCGIALGGFFALCVAALMFIGVVAPSDSAVLGTQVKGRDLKILRELKLLEDDEQVIFFYSPGLLSAREGGSFFTARRVVAFEEGDTALTAETASYAEIASVEPKLSKEWLEDSTISVTRKDGTEFLLTVSNTDHGDQKFLNRLMKEWRKHPGTPSAPPVSEAEDP